MNYMKPTMKFIRFREFVHPNNHVEGQQERWIMMPFDSIKGARQSNDPKDNPSLIHITSDYWKGWIWSSMDQLEEAVKALNYAGSGDSVYTIEPILPEPKTIVEEVAESLIEEDEESTSSEDRVDNIIEQFKN